MVSIGMDFEATMDLVLKNIYTSCDPEETNQVPSAKLIEFITPYLMQDEIAFESLKLDLDPDNQNVPISSEKFYEIMNKWAKKIANSNDEGDDEFNCTPSHLDEIDDKDLPFLQSTPRASFGQRLLSCEELLNLSNLTAADLAATVHTNDESTVGEKRQFLEEEVKRLEHQLKQALAEMDMMKGQITSTEEQNENLQAELNRYRTRLANEQQMIDLLQKDKFSNEELKEEISARKREIENLNKKIHQYEKDTSYMSMLNQKLETENTQLSQRCEDLSAKEQKLKKEVFDIKTELEVKEQDLSMIRRLNEELKQKLNEEKQIIVDLTQENDLLDYKKNSLEKRLSCRRYSSFSPCQTSKRNLSIQGSATSPLNSPHIGNEDNSLFNSSSLLKKLGSPVSPCLDSPLFSKSHTPFRFPKKSSFIPKNISDVQDHSYDEDYSFEMQTEAASSSNQHVSLHAELFQTGQFGPNNKEDNSDEEWNSDELINSLHLENEALKEQLNILNNNNEILQIQFEEANKKIEHLSKEIKKVESEKENFEQKIKYLENEKQDLENRIKNMEIRYPELLNKNHDKIQELEDTLSKARKDYSNLQTQCKIQENELAEYKNKFNFEIPFKNLQIELNQKNKELEELHQSCLNYKNLIQKLTTTNLELNKNLTKTKETLEEYVIRSREVEKLNENTQLTTAEVHLQLQNRTQCLNQVIARNKYYEEKIGCLEKQLQEKLSEITRLKDIQKKDMSIRNTMWRNFKDLKNVSDSLKDKLKESEKSIKELKEEHNKLLTTHNDEVTKNSELCEQIKKQKEELCEAIAKYHEANEKNVRLIEQIDGLKNESVEMKQNQTKCNRKILEKLGEYESMLKKYDGNIKDLEVLNSSLKLELQVEKNNFEKITEYETILEMKENTIKELEIENNSLKSDLEQLKTLSEKNNFENITTKYETILEDKEKTVRELEIAYSSLKADFEEKKRLSVENFHKSSEYKAILDKKEKTIRELEIANSSLKADFEEEKKLSVKNFDKISEYKDILQQKQKTIRELEIAKDTLKVDLEQEKKISRKNNLQNITEYEELLKAKEEAIKELKLVNDTLRADLEQEKRLSEKKDDDSSVDSFSISFPLEKSSDSKTRSFEKQQLIIDKLRLKNHNLEGELQKEKSKNIALNDKKDEIKDSFEQLQEKFEQLVRESTLEKQSSTKTINLLTEQNKSQDENLKIFKTTSEERIQNLSHTLSQIEALQIKNKLELEEKDNLLKQQFEINMDTTAKLNKTIQELNMEISNKELVLKNCLVGNKNLRNNCDNSEKKLQELSLRVFELEREVNSRREEVRLLSSCVQDKDITIQELKTKVTEFDHKFSDIFLELTEKENQYTRLLEEKENLQERLSKTDDRKEMELMDLEEKIKNSRTLLQSLEAEIGMTKRFLNETLGDYENSTKKILVEAHVVINCNKELYRALSMALKNWQVVLQNDARFKCIPPLEEESSPDIEESLFCLSEKIMVVVMLLEILATKAPMENSGNPSEVLDQSVIHNKTLKKFTLKPSKLVVGRPVSPDSPCLGFEEECGDISKSAKNLDIPDSRSFEADNKSTDVSDDVFEDGAVNASQLFSPLGLLFDDAFPHLTDNFLEKIGLHEDGTKQALSVPETERVFATFAIQIALDSTDIKERLEKQKEACEKQHRRLLHLMKDISVRLREHKCIGAMDSIKPVFVLLEDVRYLLREIMQTSGQFGILSCEHRMMRCWNMVTNYMAILKKDASISPTQRRQTMLDKEVSTSNLQEGLKTFVKQSSEACQQKIGEEALDQNEPDFTDDVVGHRCNRLFSHCKRLTKWLVFLIFFAFLGLVSIHWQCHMSTESQMCPLDAFITKTNIGTPPY